MTLWRLGGLTLRQLLSRSVASYREHQLDARSAQFAYYALLALSPLLIVVIASVAKFPKVLKSFIDAVKVGMPDPVAQLIETQVLDIEQRSHLSLIVVGLVLLGIAGSRLFLTMGAGFDAAYGVETPRRFLKAGAVALLMT